MKYTCSMETVQQNGRFTLFSSKFLSIYSILYAYKVRWILIIWDKYFLIKMIIYDWYGYLWIKMNTYELRWKIMNRNKWFKLGVPIGIPLCVTVL